jgi:hypothetical protein
MEVSVSRDLATEAELTHLIEKHAAVEHPETKKALWQRFVSAHHQAEQSPVVRLLLSPSRHPLGTLEGV